MSLMIGGVERTKLALDNNIFEKPYPKQRAQYKTNGHTLSIWDGYQKSTVTYSIQGTIVRESCGDYLFQPDGDEHIFYVNKDFISIIREGKAITIFFIYKALCHFSSLEVA